MSGLPLVEVDWQAPPGVRALATTRIGGVSVAPMDALNLAIHVDDVPDAVAENRRRLCATAGLAREPRWLRQVHGIEVADLDALPEDCVPQADAAVTTRANVTCAYSPPIACRCCSPPLMAPRWPQRMQDGVASPLAYSIPRSQRCARG